MKHEIRITIRPAKADRIYHISEEDVRVVLSRIPAETIQRVKAIYFNDESREQEDSAIRIEADGK